MINICYLPREAFSSPRSQFFTIRTDPKPANNLFIYFLLLIGLQVGLRNFVIELAGLTCACRLRTIVKIKPNERTSESNLKKHVLKNRSISNYFMKAASSSLVKCPKTVSPM